MGTKRVQERLGVAQFVIPVDWTAFPSVDDSSIQYYPEDADVVLRASALVFEIKDKTKRIDLESYLDNIPSLVNAEKGKTRAGSAWRKITTTDKEGKHTSWQVAEIQGTRLVLLVFTYSDFLPKGDPRVPTLLECAESAVDSTQFLNTKNIVGSAWSTKGHN